jgi:hypothetical protein
VVLHLDYDHPDILEFINTPRAQLPWVKRCVDVDEHLLEDARYGVIPALLEGIKRGDIWLNKIRYNEEGDRIYGNVCLEVYLQSRGTCLLQHVNLGACIPNLEARTPSNLADVFPTAMEELVALHAKTGVGSTGEYLSPDVDRQVGLGLLGLANFLAQNKISYYQFGEALEAYHEGEITTVTPANAAVFYLALGINRAASVARNAGMERAFCIAPTASCSYQNKDLRGYTTAPEIAPPISREVDRDSGTFGVQSYTYPPDIEIASEVGWETYNKVVDGIVLLFQKTGLFHGYSYNSWSDVVTYDEAFLEDWLNSPQTSLYYSLQVMPDTQSKDDALAALDDDYKDLFKLDESCSIDLKDNFCSACSE